MCLFRTAYHIWSWTWCSRSRAKDQSSFGVSNQFERVVGIDRELNLNNICFSRKPVVFSRDSLSAVTLSQDEQRGMWTTWTTLPRKAQIRCNAFTRIDAVTSPFMYRFSQPYTQATLSTCTTMCWFFSSFGISKNGSKTPTISKVAVLLPKRLPLASILFVTKSFGHHIWKASNVSPDSFKPIVPQPIFPFQTLLSANPAASDLKVLVHIGGACMGGQMGRPSSMSCKTADQMRRSSTDWSDSTTQPFLIHSARSMFSECLKQFKKGDICETWFNLPMRHCSCLVPTTCKSTISAMVRSVDSTLSLGSFQVRFRVSNRIPKTLPNFEQSKALSKLGYGGANSKFISLQSFLYSTENSSHQPELLG